MKVLHVIPGLSRESGGPSRSVQGLVAGLNAAGIDAWLLALDKGEGPWIDGVTHFINGEMFEAVVERIRPDIVHLHCIWSLALHRCAVICRRRGIPYVIAPRGMLEPWSLRQKWLKKRVARFLYQDRDLKCAAALHATAESEAEQFRRLGFKNLVIVSPNGVNVPENLEPRNTRNTRKRVLFVSRMHPKKGVLELVEAWKLVASGQWLVASEEGGIVGDWCCELVYTVSGELEREYEAKVKGRILALGMSYQDTDGSIHSSPSPSPSSSPSSSPNFIFTGALNDDEKWAAYARADVFVLPTYSENFGIVIAEALWAGVPAITTKGTPWAELETWKCGWWINLSVDGSESCDLKELVCSLANATNLSDQDRYAMGMRGRQLVKHKYTWNMVCKEMVAGYKMLEGKC